VYVTDLNNLYGVHPVLKIFFCFFLTLLSYLPSRGAYHVAMNNTSGASAPPLHSLIPMGDFKAILGLDDREDTLSAFCLITATYAIEQYCMRRLLLRRHFELVAHNGDTLLPLREYPDREVLAVHAHCHSADPELVEPELYAIVPELEGKIGRRWTFPIPCGSPPPWGGCRG
jgi:hypothetical protein